MKDNLVTLRKQIGWSQEKLAELLGVSRQTAISIERGRFNPSLPLAFTIMKTLNCEIEDIFTPGNAQAPSDNTSSMNQMRFGQVPPVSTR